MQKLIVPSKYDNKKIVNYILDQYPTLPSSQLYKALRKKDIRVNDKKISENIVIYENDEISIYISDNILFNQNIDLENIYEDDNILVINKPSGIEILSDNKKDLTITTYLSEKYSFIKPCHRLDRNTTGLVIFAKNEESLKILLEKFKNKEIKKEYFCKVYGIMTKKEDTLQDYLFKDSKKSIVYISKEPKKGYQKIITKYRVLSEDKKENTSNLNIELITGRTHQIRAHLAFIGHPIIGDGKYGKNEINKKFGVKHQILNSYKISFDFKTPAGNLQYLNNKVIAIDKIL